MTDYLAQIALSLPLVASGPPGMADPLEAPAIPQNNVGVQFVITVIGTDGKPLDISGITQMSVLLGYPDGELTVGYAAAFVTDGKDGKLAFVSATGNLYQQGLYLIQAQLITSGVGLNTVSGQFWSYARLSTTGPTPPTFTSSALIFFDSLGIRWAKDGLPPNR